MPKTNNVYQHGGELRTVNVNVNHHADTLEVELWYPPMQKGPTSAGRVRYVELDQVNVRASDGVRMHYDYERDGWVVEQPKRLSFDMGELQDPQWTEVAFVQSWAINEDKDRG